jgi:hypothetical protein
VMVQLRWFVLFICTAHLLVDELVRVLVIYKVLLGTV